MSVQSTSTANNMTRVTSFANATPCTISLWLRFLSVTGEYYVVWNHGSTAFSPCLLIDVSDTFLKLFLTSGNLDLFVPVINTWYWVAYVFNGSGNPGVAHWGANGGALTKVTGGAAAGNWGGTTMELFTDPDSERQNGQQAGLKIWNGTTGALTDDEIANEYRKFQPSKTTDLYCAIPELSSVNAGLDMSGNGRDFTVNGTLSTSRAMPPIPWLGEP